MWTESEARERSSETRIKQAVDVKADVLVTACPFCLSNFEDALKTTGHEGHIEVNDIVELAW